ncbi:neutrophilic granule protein-like [Mesocricetus auratus]|uniref:Neutrophilic granule protein-like n=1 Tax=Mesocricetus auratus TaxID=10036 RepID=A0ABM2X520_MESAU|nr:neutrophilic granule protein-like [Mesocricetus auratus]
MARLWKAFVLVVALVVVACEAHRPPRYEDIVDRAIEAYNNGRPGKSLFRLVDAPQPSGQFSAISISLEFRIKETECISNPERQPRNCNFLEDGEERDCTGQFLRRRRSTSLTLSCDRDCSREGAPVKEFSDYTVQDVSEKDQVKDFPPGDQKHL